MATAKKLEEPFVDPSMQPDSEAQEDTFTVDNPAAAQWAPVSHATAGSPTVRRRDGFEHKFCANLPGMCAGILGIGMFVGLGLLLFSRLEYLQGLEYGQCSLTSPESSCFFVDSTTSPRCYEPTADITVTGISASSFSPPVSVSGLCISERELASVTERGETKVLLNQTEGDCRFGFTNGTTGMAENWEWKCLYDGDHDEFIIDPKLNLVATATVVVVFVGIGTFIGLILSWCLWIPCYWITKERVDYLFERAEDDERTSLCSTADLKNPCLPFLKLIIIVLCIPWLLWYIFARGLVLLGQAVYKYILTPIGRGTARCCSAIGVCCGACWGAICLALRPCYEAIGRCCRAVCKAIYTGCLRPIGRCIGHICSALGSCLSSICGAIGRCCAAIGRCFSSIGRAIGRCVSPLCGAISRCCGFIWRTISGAFSCLYHNCLSPCCLGIKRCCAAFWTPIFHCFRAIFRAICVPIGRGIASVCRAIGRMLAAIGRGVQSVGRSIARAF